MTLSIDDIMDHARLDSGLDDEALIREFLDYLPSYNAEAAFSALLALACSIAAQRPRLFPRLLSKVVEPAFCMGVDSVQHFVDYANSHIEHDGDHGDKWRVFTASGLDFYRESIRHHASAIEKRLAELRDEVTSDL